MPLRRAGRPRSWVPRTAPPRAVETRRTSSDVTEVRLTLLSFDITWSLTYYSHSAIFVKRTLRSGGASGLSCSSGEAEHFRRARRPPRSIYHDTPREKRPLGSVGGSAPRGGSALGKLVPVYAGRNSGRTRALSHRERVSGPPWFARKQSDSPTRSRKTQCTGD